MTGKILYLDASSGASGDMMLGTMVEMGADFKALIKSLRGLRGLPKFEARLDWADRHGIRARRVEVRAPGHHEHEHRSLADVEKIVRSGKLPAPALEGALSTFRLLARAEARVHGSSVDKVHFHEVGATDAVVDILGAWVGLGMIGSPRIVASPIGLEQGPARGRAAHGAMILPSPATLELLKGVPVLAQPSDTELCTPTGAALLLSMASAFGPMPSLTAERVSYATGKRENPALPSVLRGILGSPAKAEAGVDEIVEISTNLDDISPLALAPACEAILAAGALDVSVTPIMMKKGRAGFLLRVLAQPKDEARLAVLVLKETPSFGVRVATKRRYMKAREIHARDTAYGKVRYKVGKLHGKTVTVSPEPEDVLAASKAAGTPAHKVLADLHHEAEHHHDHPHHHGHGSHGTKHHH